MEMGRGLALSQGMWSDAFDGRPGVPPEMRYLPDAVIVLLQVVWGPAASARGQLILRCDKDGRLSAAISAARQADIRTEK
jgi:hypothetical protein